MKPQWISSILPLLATSEQSTKGRQGRWTSARDFGCEGQVKAKWWAQQKLPARRKHSGRAIAERILSRVQSTKRKKLTKGRLEAAGDAVNDNTED